MDEVMHHNDIDLINFSLHNIISIWAYQKIEDQTFQVEGIDIFREHFHHTKINWGIGLKSFLVNSRLEMEGFLKKIYWE